MAEDLKYLTAAVIVIIIVYIFYAMYQQHFSIYTSGSLQRYASVLSSTDERPYSGNPFNKLNVPTQENFAVKRHELKNVNPVHEKFASLKQPGMKFNM